MRCSECGDYFAVVDLGSFIYAGEPLRYYCFRCYVRGL